MTALLHALDWLRLMRNRPYRRRTVEHLARRLGASRKQANRIASHF